MDRAWLAERQRMRVTDAPRDTGARRGVVLAVDDVADAADGEPERDADDRRVEHEAERQAEAPRGDVAEDRRAERSPHGANATVPDREGLDRVPGVAGPAVEQMHEPRADEPAGDDREGEGVDALILDQVARAAEREPGAREQADVREHGVPGDPQRPE